MPRFGRCTDTIREGISNAQRRDATRSFVVYGTFEVRPPKIHSSSGGFTLESPARIEGAITLDRIFPLPDGPKFHVHVIDILETRLIVASSDERKIAH